MANPIVTKRLQALGRQGPPAAKPAQQPQQGLPDMENPFSKAEDEEAAASGKRGTLPKIRAKGPAAPEEMS